MSLIQAALNKTQLEQEQPEKKTADPVAQVKSVPVARVWPGVMDEQLERELRNVQLSYNKRRAFWWKVVAGLALFFITLSLVMLIRSTPRISGSKPLPPEVLSSGVPTVVPMSAEIPVSVRPSYFLSGIVDLGSGPRAIINDQIVSAGDTVSNGAVVRQIGQDSVLLELGDEVFRLKMKM